MTKEQTLRFDPYSLRSKSAAFHVFLKDISCGSRRGLKDKMSHPKPCPPRHNPGAPVPTCPFFWFCFGVFSLSALDIHHRSVRCVVATGNKKVERWERQQKRLKMCSLGKESRRKEGTSNAGTHGWVTDPVAEETLLYLNFYLSFKSTRISLKLSLQKKKKKNILPDKQLSRSDSHSQNKQKKIVN